jgi:hypothetical protein
MAVCLGCSETITVGRDTEAMLGARIAARSPDLLRLNEVMRPEFQTAGGDHGAVPLSVCHRPDQHDAQIRS